MHRVKQFCRAFLIVGLLSCASSAWADYAAIAYSESTGCYGYAYGCGSLEEATAAALNNCRGRDAYVVVWVEDGYVALALGDRPNAVGWAFSTNCRADAELLALQNAHDCEARIAASIYSGR
jgi:hypothetical protein